MALMMFRGEYESNYPILFAGVMTVSLPMVAACVFLQRWFVAGVTTGALKA
jgi:raffinose/stachyose/melibiose transport system permease protein